MLKKLQEYIQDNDFRLTIFNNKLYIINYIKIISLENDKIIVEDKNKKIIIKGENFILNKLLEKEALISGVITNIEVRYD